MATSRSRNVAVTVKRQKVRSAGTLAPKLAFPRVQRSTQTAPFNFFTDSPMTMARLLIGQGPQNIPGGGKPVADEGVPACTSRHDSSATICPQQLVFNIKHV